MGTWPTHAILLHAVRSTPARSFIAAAHHTRSAACTVCPPCKCERTASHSTRCPALRAVVSDDPLHLRRVAFAVVMPVLAGPSARCARQGVQAPASLPFERQPGSALRTHSSLVVCRHHSPLSAPPLAAPPPSLTSLGSAAVAQPGSLSQATSIKFADGTFHFAFNSVKTFKPLS